MTESPVITDGDRFGVSLTFSIVMHGILLLGVGFTLPETGNNQTVPELDVILVHQRSDKAPEKADFVAQSNQAGGGDLDTPARPSAPISSQVPKPDPGLAPIRLAEKKPAPEKKSSVQQVSTLKSKLKTKDKTSEKKKKSREPSSADLLQHSLDMARLEMEISKQLQNHAQRPRRKFVSASTREHDYAAYMNAWINKVERVGNLNYPAKARKKNINGSLVMSVVIDASGKLLEVKILESSGHPELDEAAKQIARLAAPYPPFPEEILQKTDIMHISRTWQFLPGNRLSSR